MTSSKELWTNLHKESRYRPKYPSETVVQYVFRNFERCGSEKVLDLGCGAGRHIFFMAAEGIIPYGLDYSSEGVTYTQNMLQEQGIGKYSSNIKEGSMTEIPFENEMFDGIICYGALYYLRYKDIERTICEMERVLKPGGKFMCVVRSTDDYRCQEENCKETEEPNTFYIEVEDKSKCAHSENGMILHFFTEQEITTLFKNFVEISIDKITESHNNGKEGYIDMIVLSGHQPNYLPYPGLIGKILHSDKFIYVSNVQLEKKSWQNRNRIKGANGEIMLSVPVLTKGKFNQTIRIHR